MNVFGNFGHMDGLELANRRREGRLAVRLIVGQTLNHSGHVGRVGKASKRA